ncbi:MAG: hypothetical protein IMZ58_11880 [Thermoplasmata archaeon]|nr:hypothetical protein [Thermoplasmata archaeon]
MNEIMDSLKEIQKNLVYCNLNQSSFATCEHLSYFGDIPICKGSRQFEGSCPYREIQEPFKNCIKAQFGNCAEIICPSKCENYEA